jgi:hypothetical protein
VKENIGCDKNMQAQLIQGFRLIPTHVRNHPFQGCLLAIFPAIKGGYGEWNGLC